MSIACVINSSALFVLLIAACVTAIPVQMRGENDVVYADPEVVEALARSYAALEWAERHDRSANDNVEGMEYVRDIQARNLDQIGGGNLLRSIQNNIHRPQKHQTYRPTGNSGNYLY